MKSLRKRAICNSLNIKYEFERNGCYEIKFNAITLYGHDKNKPFNKVYKIVLNHPELFKQNCHDCREQLKRKLIEIT